MHRVSTPFHSDFEVYEADTIGEACGWAQNFIKTVQPLRSNRSQPSLVFDVDDTLIDVQSDRAIEEVAQLYAAAESLGCQKFVITARPERSARWTHTQLSSLEGDMPVRMYHTN